MRSDKPVIMVAVVIIAVMLLGEAFTLLSDGSAYGAECSRDGDVVSYSVKSAGADTYGVTVISGSSVTDLYLYVDEGYGDKCVRGSAPVGSSALTPARFMSELKTILSERGFTSVHDVDAEGLKALCSDTASAAGRGVVCVSGLLPDTVYDGTSSSTVLSWISAGGTLYWAGNVIGEYTGHDGSDPTTVSGGSALFLGASSSVPRTEDAYATSVTGDLTETIGLRGNGLDFAPVTSSLSSSLVAGYTDGERSSVTFCGLGSGQVCVMGGALVFNHYRDLAQLVCSGASLGSTLLAHVSGNVVRGTVSGELDLPSGSPDVTVYVFIGKGVDNTLFGRVFREAP